MHAVLHCNRLHTNTAIMQKWHSSLPGDEEEEVLGMLGSLLTTVRSLPLGTLGSPSEAMGMVTVPGVLLVTTTTCPAVFWKVACAPTPFKMAAVGVLLPLV